MNDDLLNLLKQGVRAAKSGDRERARQLLMAYVEQEEENEKAWLWLSRVVDQIESKRVCLDNVLTLNPDNALAASMLEELEAANKIVAETDQSLMSEQQEELLENWSGDPNSASDDELIYDKYDTTASGVMQDSGMAETADFRIGDENLTYEGAAIYEDIWSDNVDICAYCANPLAEGENRCPQCGRNLIERQFRLQYPSKRIGRYGVVLCSLIPLLGIQLGYNLYYQDIAPHSGILIPVNIIFITTLMLLAYGVYQRDVRSYKYSVYLLALILLMGLVQLVWDNSFGDFLGTEGLNESGTLVAEGEEGTGNWIWDILFYMADTERWLSRFLEVTLPAMQTIAAFVLAYYGYLVVSPDFDQDDVRQIAIMDEQRLEQAADYYVNGKEAARRQRWATAVLYFRSASMRDPNKLLYQQALGTTYAKLHFYRRSIDTLHYARKKAETPQDLARLDKLIQHVQTEEKSYKSKPSAAQPG